MIRNRQTRLKQRSPLQSMTAIAQATLQATEQWASEPDAARKEALFEKALDAAATQINAELLFQYTGQCLPETLRLPDDWRRLAGPLAAERLKKIAFAASRRRAAEKAAATA